MKRDSIIFLYGTPYVNFGSSVMRGQQLSKIASSVINKVSYQPVSDGLVNSILFMTKGAIAASTVNLLYLLKNRGNILIFDPLDSTPSKDKMDLADVIVAASEYAQRLYGHYFPNKPCRLIDHHVDPRLPEIHHSAEDPLRIGYFGEPVNTISTPRIAKEISLVRVDTARLSCDWMNQLPKYNMHYCLRMKQKQLGPKPFNKGFLAAHLGCNILVHEEQEDAKRWLGDDYPYLIKGALTEQAILDKIEYAKSTYKTEIWKSGLDVMNSIKNKTSNESIASQVSSLMDEVSLL